MSGTIPTELALLPLRSLILADNKFTGSIPTQFRNLSSLVLLYVPFPSHTLLTTVSDLGRNGLTGRLNPALAALPKLAQLDLSSNRFEGPIPTQIGDSALVLLDLSSNRFGGPIPTQVGKLIGLTTINLQFNQLEGTLPTQIQYLENLRKLYVLPSLSLPLSLSCYSCSYSF